VRLTLAFAALVVLCATCSPSERSREASASGLARCPRGPVDAAQLISRPEVLAILHRQRFPEPHVSHVVKGVGAAERMIIALSWHGPEMGVLLVSDCAGRITASVDAGYVDSLADSPLTKLPELVVAYGHSGGAVSYSSEGVAVWSLDDDSLSLVWNGFTYESSASAVDYEQRATVTFSAPDTIKRVLHYSSARPRVVGPNLSPAKLQYFVWNPPSRAFVPVR